MNREGGFSVSREDVIEEIDIFEGNENRLTFEEVFQTLTVQMKTVSGVHEDLQVHLPAADVPFRQPGDRCGWILEEHVWPWSWLGLLCHSQSEEFGDFCRHSSSQNHRDGVWHCAHPICHKELVSEVFPQHSWRLLSQDSRLHQSRRLRWRSPAENRFQTPDSQCDPHRLPSNHPRPHHCLRHKLLQGILLRGVSTIQSLELNWITNVFRRSSLWTWLPSSSSQPSSSASQEAFPRRLTLRWSMSGWSSPRFLVV